MGGPQGQLQKVRPKTWPLSTVCPYNNSALNTKGGGRRLQSKDGSATWKSHVVKGLTSENLKVRRNAVYGRVRPYFSAGTALQYFVDGYGKIS